MFMPYTTVQKKLADAEGECTRLALELANATNAKPVTEIRTVEVETLPKSLKNLEDALQSELGKLKATREEQARLEVRIAEQHAEAEEQAYRNRLVWRRNRKRQVSWPRLRRCCRRGQS